MSKALSDAATKHEEDLAKERIAQKAGTASLVEAAAQGEKASRELAAAISASRHLQSQLDEVLAENAEAMDLMLQFQGLYTQQRQCSRTEDLVELARLRQVVHDLTVEVRELRGPGRANPSA